MTTDDARAEVDWLAERARLHRQAIDVLTRAVRLTRPAPAGAMGAPEDFAGFLAEVLAAVAANVGATRLVTAGRPGSWEAELVHQLIAGTVGHDDEYLLSHRTEPVRVTLNVAHLVDELGSTGEPPVQPIDEALDAIWIAAEGAAIAAAEPTDDEAEAAWQAIEAAEADLTARYRTAYTTYAQAFTAAVTEAAKTIDGLTVPVEVITEADPEGWSSEIDNPTDVDGDPLVWQLWSTAFDQVGLPRP